MLRFKDRRAENEAFFRYGVMFSRMYDFTVNFEIMQDIMKTHRRKPDRTTDDILTTIKMIDICMKKHSGGVNVSKNFDEILSAFDNIYPTVGFGLRRKMYTHRRCSNILSPLKHNMILS